MSKNKQTVAEFIADFLYEEEVRNIFMPGNRNAVYVNREFANIPNQNFITFVEDGISETNI